MSLSISTSPDITLLDFAILYDLSTGVPSIVLTNDSVGNPSGITNLDNCTWWYAITTPSGVYIHQGTESSPDVTTANWTTLTIPTGAWPTPFGTPPYGQVEFSCGVPYSATLYVKDSEDNIFSTTKSTTICRPTGNTDSTKGNFGVAGVQVTVKCDIASIYTNDITNYTYQNKIGVFDSNSWTLAYPMDDAGNIPAPVVVINQGRVIFPVGYSAEGYQLYLNTIASYDMGDDQTIKLQYKFKDVFNVYCNSNLCEIQCQIDALQKQADTSCGQVENPAVNKKLAQVQSLLLQAITGVMQPLCGINVPAIIEKAKAIGGAKCNCTTLGGINPIASTDGSINIELALTGLTGAVSNMGNNYVITLANPGTSGTLQQVTDNGNITTNNMISGNSTAAHAVMSPAKYVVYKDAVDQMAGIGMTPGLPRGSVWVHSDISHGTVYITANDNTNTYIMVLPDQQATAPGQALINDGVGNLSWASATGDLQTVTDIGNVTTNDVVSGDNTIEHGVLNNKRLLLGNGTDDIVYLENASGAGRLVFKDPLSSFTTIIRSAATALGTNLVFLTPKWRNGTFALSGLGTTVTAIAGTGAGTGPTITIVGNHTSGIITVVVGTAPAAASNIVRINLGTQYLSSGIVWRGVISDGNVNAATLLTTQGVSVQSPVPDVSGDELWINSGNVALVAGTQYAWYYCNNF